MANKTPVLQFPAAQSERPAALPPDFEAREQALDVTASWIVEAPAGSGKTGLLMQRYLKLLAHDSVSQPEEVLAITFTRKATAELRERILNQLHKAQLTIQSSQLKTHADPAGAPSTTEVGAPFIAEALAAMGGPPQNPTPDLNPFDTTSRTLAQAVLERDRTLNWGLLDHPQRLNIRTIDSVCAEIAATLPLLSGSGAARTPSPNPEPLYRLAAQRTLMQLGGPDAALSAAIRNVLLHRDGSLADCEILLARMLAAREQWGELVPLGAQLEDEALETEVRPKLERALEQIICAGLTRAAKAMPPDMLIALSWLAARLAHEPGYKGAPSPIYICANKSDPPETQAEHFDHWTALIGLLVTNGGDWRTGFNVNHVGLALSKEDKALLKQLIDEVRDDHHLRDALCAVRALPPARYPDEQWAVAKALFHLLVRALAELKVLFSERGQCDFTELSMAAKEALHAEGGTADLSSASGSTLRHLLVDEMQDTSSSQYELIEMLSRSWDGHSQTLFLVGDPKQSIYLFRQARVERFLRTMRDQRLGEIPLGALHLTANFRSQATLVENFNHDFSYIFPSPDDEPLDVPFVHADPIRKTSSFAAGLVWNTSILGLLPDDPEAAPDAKRERRLHTVAEARRIRRIVENWRARPLPEGRTGPWRIAVLARARTHLTSVIAEFDRPGADGNTIPFRALEIEQLGERPEVLDALALTRALLHPADRVAWLAVLHAPWCGLGVADLLAISGGGTSEAAKEPLPAVIASRRDQLSTDGQKLFDRIWPVLSSALLQRGRSGTAILVERTWRSLGGDAALTPQQLTNVDLFLTALREVEEPGGRVDLGLLTESVRRLYAEPRTGDNLVDLSTIHRAKGLEWDVVLIPALERPGQSSRTELLNWLELDFPDAEVAHVVLAPIYGRGAESDALNKWLTSVRSTRDAAERKRLYYVACTRAREELHLFAAATRKANGELCAKAGTLLQAAWPAALPHFNLDATLSPAEMFRRSLDQEDEFADPYGEGLAIAASAENPALKGTGSSPYVVNSATQGHSAADEIPGSRPNRPLLHRFPLTFDPHARFQAAAARKLPYTPAAALRQAATFDRPEGSYSVRAFGNVVHRYLQLLSTRLEATPDPTALVAELPTWLPRLTASLRSEGLAPATLDRLAQRSLHALQQALTDATGRWILSPHAASHSEQSLRLAALNASEIRVDRTFIAGPDPLSQGSSHLWIIDFKTTEQGSRSDEDFVQQEKAKYGAQLESYARAQLSLPNAPAAVIQGLYYPLVPRLIYWNGSI